MELPLGINIVNIIIYSILFAVLYSILAKFLFPALGKAMSVREAKLNETIENAQKAESLLSVREKEMHQLDKQTSEIIAEAKKQARVEYDKIIAQARDEGREIVTKAYDKAEDVKNSSSSEYQILVAEKVKIALEKIWNDKNLKIEEELIKRIVKES
jgi:F-type H+-transporting ATPase subunit b